MGLVYAGRAFFKKDSNRFLFFLMLIIALSTGFSYAYFCWKYPVGCSSNARYALLLFIPIQVTLASGFVDFVNAIIDRVKEIAHKR
jgi:hypothetical protein